LLILLKLFIFIAAPVLKAPRQPTNQLYQFSYQAVYGVFGYLLMALLVSSSRSASLLDTAQSSWR